MGVILVMMPPAGAAAFALVEQHSLADALELGQQCRHRHGQAGTGGFAAHQVEMARASTQVNRCTRILSVKWRMGRRTARCGPRPGGRGFEVLLDR